MNDLTFERALNIIYDDSLTIYEQVKMLLKVKPDVEFRRVIEENKPNEWYVDVFGTGFTMYASTEFLKVWNYCEKNELKVR